MTSAADHDRDAHRRIASRARARSAEGPGRGRDQQQEREEGPWPEEGVGHRAARYFRRATRVNPASGRAHSIRFNGLTLASGVTYSRVPFSPSCARLVKADSVHADLPSQHEHPREGQHLRGAVRGRRRPVARPRDQPLALRHAGGRRARASRCSSATSTTSAASGIDCRYCHTSVETAAVAGIPPTQDLHELPLADLEPTSPMLEPVRESFRSGQVDRVDPRPRPAGLRLLQPQRPREQGRRLRDLPRPRRPDAARVAGEVAADGVVPRLPPRRRSSTCGRATRSSTWPGSRPPTSSSMGRKLVQEYASEAAHELLDVSPMSDAMSSSARSPRCASTSPRSRRRANGASGRRLLASLEELADTPGFQDFLHREFPRARVRAGPTPRAAASFLQLMGASLALAGLTGCTRQPDEKIVPYVQAARGARARPAALLRDRA